MAKVATRSPGSDWGQGRSDRTGPLKQATSVRGPGVSTWTVACSMGTSHSAPMAFQ